MWQQKSEWLKNVQPVVLLNAPSKSEQVVLLNGLSKSEQVVPRNGLSKSERAARLNVSPSADGKLKPTMQHR